MAMENICLLDRICGLLGFHEGREREVMQQEISTLRDQLLEALDGKIADDEGLILERKALEPELAAAARVNELLRKENDNHRLEVEELRSNFSSSLGRMGREVKELQELVEKLKVQLAGKGEHSVTNNVS